MDFIKTFRRLRISYGILLFVTRSHSPPCFRHSQWQHQLPQLLWQTRSLITLISVSLVITIMFLHYYASGRSVHKGCFVIIRRLFIDHAIKSVDTYLKVNIIAWSRQSGQVHTAYAMRNIVRNGQINCFMPWVRGGGEEWLMLLTIHHTRPRQGTLRILCSVTSAHPVCHGALPYEAVAVLLVVHTD